MGEVQGDVGEIRRLRRAAISLIPPMYLPYISLYLPYISHTSPLHLPISHVTTVQRGTSAHASSIGDFAPIRAAISRSADL